MRLRVFADFIEGAFWIPFLGHNKATYALPFFIAFCAFMGYAKYVLEFGGIATGFYDPVLLYGAKKYGILCAIVLVPFWVNQCIFRAEVYHNFLWHNFKIGRGKTD